jgi:hypothetical protein
MAMFRPHVLTERTTGRTLRQDARISQSSWRFPSVQMSMPDGSGSSYGCDVSGEDLRSSCFDMGVRLIVCSDSSSDATDEILETSTCR